MKKLIVLGLCAAFLAGCNEMGASRKTSLVTEKEKLSYALGSIFGMQAHAQLVARDSIDLDLAVFNQAFVEHYKMDSAKYLLSDSMVRVVLNDFSEKLRAEQMKKDSIANAKTLEEGRAFLAKNKTAEGVVTTESGLQYKVIAEGKGKSPADSAIVSVHYVGKLLDGSEFDSSIKRGQPSKFPINAVIPGWTELLKLMKVGGKVVAWIPSELAYGTYGRPPMIPGNSVLEFEVELLDIVAADSAQK